MKRMSRSFDNDISNLGTNLNDDLLHQLEDILIDSGCDKSNNNVQENCDSEPSSSKESTPSLNNNIEQQIQTDTLNVYLLVIIFKVLFLYSLLSLSVIIGCVEEEKGYSVKTNNIASLLKFLKKKTYFFKKPTLAKKISHCH